MSGLTYWPSPADVVITTRRRRHASAPALGPRKPLHLDGRVRPIDVRVAGAALAVERGGRRFTLPMARIARVLVCGRVHWESAALALCMQQRVPVVFLDAHARPTGAALSLVAQTSALDELLLAFSDGRNWRSRYDNWLRSQRLRVLARWQRDSASAGRPVGRAEWIEQVRAFAYRDEANFIGSRAAAAYSVVLSVLLRTGVRSQYRGADGGVLALANDLGRILDRRAALQLGSMADAFEEQGALKAQAAAFTAAEQETFVVELLERLHRCLADWIEPWP